LREVRQLPVMPDLRSREDEGSERVSERASVRVSACLVVAAMHLCVCLTG
jgi:hypothetical protein